MNQMKYLWSCILLGISIIFLGGCSNTASSCVVEDLTVNYRENPIGIDENPVFSWKLKDTTQGQKQTAYQIVVAGSQEKLDKEEYLWDSGKVESGISVAIPYAGDVLAAETRYYWQVNVWDKDNKKIEAQQEAYFETAIADEDWDGAEWICLQKTEESSEYEERYTMEYDVRMDSASNSGFVWGATERAYGNHMICSIDTTGEEFDLVISEMHGEKIIKASRFALVDYGFEKDSFWGVSHHVQIDVDGTEISVLLDEILVAQDTLGKQTTIGQVGFWTTRGAFYAYYDNVIVSNNTGERLYEETFEQRGNNMFKPYYNKLVDGWAEASSGYLLTLGGEEPAPMLRKEFEVSSQIVSARLYASALGIYNIYMNGEKVGDEYFSPGQSVYSKEVYYRAYDVTDYVKEGDNAIGVMLGHGRYDRAKATWGDTLAFCGKLVLNYEDGKKQVIVSDSSWMGYADGPIRNDDMFLGEYYDAGFEVDGWTDAEFSEENWRNVSIYEGSKVKLVASDSEPVRCIQELSPVTVTEPVDDVFVYDFGQNMNGMCRIKVKGKPGQVITLRFAEALNEENMSCKDDLVGTIWTQNLYTADNTDYYVLRGTEEEVYEPAFVCRGFRYVQITGIEEALPIEQVTGVVLSSDLKRNGYFECSDTNVNRLYQSIYWTQLDNFVDIPVDCPQRDERFGWAGDAQVFAPTAAYNADIYQFMRQYVTALRLGQNADGSYPELAPSISTDGGSNGWSDAGIILVWELYQQYGDITIVEENFDAMCRYMEYLVETSDNFLRVRSGYNDHNAVSTLDDTMCNTAQCAYVANLLTKMCEIVGEEELAKKYQLVAEQYKKAWLENYINEDGSIDCWLQSAYTLGIAFDLYPEGLEAAGATCLKSAVEFNDNHLNTGFVATPYLLQTLCDYGYADTAYKVLMQPTYPSWNYMLSHGATTITEAWNTYYDNGDGTYGINGSLNHYGLGAVGAWLYEDVLGIRQDENHPGFKHFHLEPIVGGGLSYAKGSYESVYGTIVSEWNVEGNELVFHFVIPANTSATVSLPSVEYQNLELQAGEYEYRVKIDS